MSKRTREDYESSQENSQPTESSPSAAPQAGDRLISYSDQSATTPAGPYSYTAEKRQKLFQKESRPRDAARPHTDAYFGQQNAFPAPESPTSSIAGDEDVEAWAYLRSVRAEAEGLPSVFRASGGDATATGDAANGTGHGAADPNEGVVFDDGAVIARAREEVSTALPARQEAYYTALLARFHRHRDALSRPTDEGDEEFASAALVAGKQPIAVAGLAQAAILRLLQLLDDRLDVELSAAPQVPAYIGAWAWALLGLLEGPGGLSSAEVGTVRDLAKRCAWGVAWTKVCGEAVGAEVTGMLEMVVTLVGEVWGQRDLLEGRPAWDE